MNLIIENKDIKSFVDAVNYVTPLELQDVEGMTEAFNLDLDTQNGERIKYYDVISLYTYRPVKLSYDMITEDFWELMRVLLSVKFMLQESLAFRCCLR